jgi:hypothetical protein
MALWRWAGLPALFAVFYYFLSRGGWSGRFLESDFNYVSIAGLVPHSDAAGYYLDSLKMALTGEWGGMSSRRPVAASARQLLTTLADYSYVRTIYLQAVLLTVLAWFATYRLIQWRGALAGIVFAALIVQLARPFLSSTLTEPIGMMWALVSIIFLIEALRRHDRLSGMIALVALVFGMLTRLGALFLIAWVAIWLVLCFADDLWSRLRLAALAAVCIVLPVIFNVTASRLYANPGTTTGANFSMTLCGLTLGGSWHRCAALYADEVQRVQSEDVQIYLQHASENFRANPSVLFAKLIKNAGAYVSRMPSFLINGYLSVTGLSPHSGVGSLANIVGILIPLLVGAYLIRFASWTERIFWAGSLTAIVASAAIIYADDGWRALHVSHVYVALLIACGFAVRRRPEISVRDVNPTVGASAIAVVILFMIAVPALAHWAFRRELASHTLPTPRADQQIMLGGHRFSGLLVFPDDQVAPTDTPSMKYSEFARMVNTTRVNGEPGIGLFLDRLDHTKPFAFVNGAIINAGSDDIKFVAPPHMLTNRAAWAWLLTLDRPRTDAVTLYFVTEAIAIP